MEDKKTIIQLWSVAKGKLVDFEVTVENGEFVARHEDEFVKFPGGITVEKFRELIKAHNEANDGLVGITKEELEAEKELHQSNLDVLGGLNKEES